VSSASARPAAAETSASASGAAPAAEAALAPALLHHLDRIFAAVVF
jgi:hypothetical protein